MKKFTSWSLKYKIFAIAMFNSITILLCAALGYHLYTKAYNKLLFESMAGSLSATSKQISQKLENAEYISSLILSSSVVQEKLANPPSGDDPLAVAEYNRTVNNLLTEYSTLFRTNGISYAALYSDTYINSSNWAALNKTPGFLLNTALENAFQAKGAVTWTYAERQPYILLGRNVREIQNLSLRSLGNLVIGVDLERIVSDATQFISQYRDQQFIIASTSGSLLYASDHLSDADARELIQDFSDSYKIVSYGGHKYFSVAGTLPHYEYYYVTLAPYDSVANALGNSMRLISLFLIIGMLLVFYMSNRLIHTIIHEFDALIRNMELFTQNELELPEENSLISYSAEVGTLHRQFRLMATRIQNLVKVNYVNEILTRDAQLKALRSQISPHFLYNTLETINWRAKAMGNEVISQMVESLGNLLRVSLSDQDTLVTLAYELELVNSYVTIQKIRFEERLAFQVITEESVSDGMIPPLTIQPLVENAIHYGMEEMTEVCHIYLQIQVTDGIMMIQVRNEGSHFEKDLLEKLKNKSRSPHGFGIGLLNIDQRIKLLFGEAYGLTLSNENNFAVATITLPYRKKEDEQHVKTTDC